MNRLVRNGKVAVLISKSYGGGWYTDNRDVVECLFHPNLVLLVEQNASNEELLEEAKKLFGEEFEGDANGLEVEWVELGIRFRVNNYDGWERIVPFDEEDWIFSGEVKEEILKKEKDSLEDRLF